LRWLAAGHPCRIEEANHDLIIFGVGRRLGGKLFFGDTAAAVLEKSPASIQEVAAPRHSGAAQGSNVRS
jgi:hypothetical protein